MPTSNSYEYSRPLPNYLLRFHIAGSKVFYAVHEAVLRHLVVRPKELLELQRQWQNNFKLEPQIISAAIKSKSSNESYVQYKVINCIVLSLASSIHIQAEEKLEGEFLNIQMSLFGRDNLQVYILVFCWITTPRDWHDLYKGLKS